MDNVGTLVMRALAVGMLALVGLSTNAGPSRSQAATENSAPSVEASAVIFAEPDVVTPISIRVGPAGDVLDRTFLRIRGLPASVQLSEGHAITPGAWAVPLKSLSNLKLIAAIEGSGRAELDLALVHVDRGVLAERKVTLIIAPAWLLKSVSPGSIGAPAAASAASQTNTTPAPAKPDANADQSQDRSAPDEREVAAPAPAGANTTAAQPAGPAAAGGRFAETFAPAATPARPLAPVLSEQQRALAERLIRRGDDFLRHGNLAAARPFYRRAATVGLARGALRLGATFDPIELAKLPTAGLAPDPKLARKWYERARMLGAAEATARLSRLNAR